jgi:hypothetical protein
MRTILGDEAFEFITGLLCWVAIPSAIVLGVAFLIYMLEKDNNVTEL